MLTLFLFILPYHKSLPIGPPDYTLCPHKADVGKFLLVYQHWHVYVMWSPLENVSDALVLVSPAVSRMSRSSYLYGFIDGRYVATQLPGLLICLYIVKWFPILQMIKLFHLT